MQYNFTYITVVSYQLNLSFRMEDASVLLMLVIVTVESTEGGAPTLRRYTMMEHAGVSSAPLPEA
jgi:hypothetical protein